MLSAKQGGCDMQNYLFSIKDGDGDQIEFEYDPEEDFKNMRVSITDLDGDTSVYVNFCVVDIMSLQRFLNLAVDSMIDTIKATAEEKEKGKNND
jgi:YD repeat-containing protein